MGRDSFVLIARIGCVVGAAALACVGLEGQTRGVPYDADFGSGFGEMELHVVSPGGFARMADVSFRGRDVTIFGEGKKVLRRAKLRNGVYESRSGGGSESLKVDSVHYLPADDVGREFALVLYTWFAASGSSNTDGVAQVFELEARHLRLLQQFSWDEHFESDGAYASFDEKSHKLIVRSGHYLPGDAHCCVSALDVITLRWDGSRYRKVSVRVELSKYGRENGKRLEAR